MNVGLRFTRRHASHAHLYVAIVRARYRKLGDYHFSFACKCRGFGRILPHDGAVCAVDTSRGAPILQVIFHLDGGKALAAVMETDRQPGVILQFGI
jgi:hypothetical protein